MNTTAEKVQDKSSAGCRPWDVDSMAQSKSKGLGTREDKGVILSLKS